MALTIGNLANDLFEGGHVSFLEQEIVVTKLRHYIDLSILLKLYYALIYPFLIYGIIIWVNTYESTLKPILFYTSKVSLAYYHFFSI